METMLIQTKFNPPLAAADWVKRPLLFNRLNQNLDRSFTLVSAPAGFGKTTLIAAWLADQPYPYAWISLDKFDNELAVLLKYVVTAVRQVFSDAFPRLWQVLQVPDLPAENELSALVINELGKLPYPLLLALDDCHLVTNPIILQLLERFLTQSQQKLHLVMMSRMDPLLPLARLRLQGIVEIRQKDLQFTDDEAGAYLQTVTGDVAADDTIVCLNGRLEGWIAGLRLLALSAGDICRAEQMTLEMQPGARNYISQYLFTEVLAQQEPDVQQFLLRTAFVDRFCPELGDALMMPLASAPIFEHLRRANLFVIPLDEDGVWFRYHHLFQQMLQQKASLQFDTEMIDSLHMRTGDWFAENGFVDEALQHYLDGEAMETAVSLIEANSRNLLNGLARQRLERWLTLLPDETIWERPRLLVAQAWLLYRHWRLQTLATVLERIQVCLDAEETVLEAGEKEFILGQVYTLNSVIAYCVQHDFTAAKTATEQAIRLLPPSEQGALASAISYRALSLQAEGEGKTAVVELQHCLQDPAPQGPAWPQLYLGICFTQLNDGDLLSFYRTVSQFLASVSDGPVGITPANWLSGIAHYEANRLDAASQAFAITAKLHYVTNFMAACDSWLGLARVCQEQGALAQAQQHLDTVHAEALRLECADLLSAIESVQAYQWHLEGKTDAALRWASAFDPNNAPNYIQLTFLPLLLWVRVVVAHGDDTICEIAKRILLEKLIIAQKTHNVRRQIQLLAHLALVESRLGNKDVALCELQKVVELGQAGGFVRSLIDCGSTLRPYLQQLQQQAIAPHYIEQLLAAYPSNGSNGVNGHSLELLLTDRETEILQMMYSGQSNKQIAQELVISLYTVKRHASNIYRKLDVNGRREAVSKAKNYNLFTTS